MNCLYIDDESRHVTGRNWRKIIPMLMLGKNMCTRMHHRLLSHLCGSILDLALTTIAMERRSSLKWRPSVSIA